MYLIITIGSLLFLAVAYIIYNHHKCDFMDADNTTDDGDNEFDQLEEMSKEIERLTKLAEQNQKDASASWIES